MEGRKRAMGELIVSMVLFGTIGVFVRSIPLSSAAIAAAFTEAGRPRGLIFAEKSSGAFPYSFSKPAQSPPCISSILFPRPVLKGRASRPPVGHASSHRSTPSTASPRKLPAYSMRQARRISSGTISRRPSPIQGLLWSFPK